MAALLVGAWYVGRRSVSVTGADATAASSPSIAVLPFVNMSSDPEQEYFSDGISEELLTLSATIPGLRVASRTSAFSYKGQELEIPEIARRLNVEHVLEGSVRKAGREVRITAQLVDARSDTPLWSETWNRTLEDIFAVQDEIAARVMERLEFTLFGAAPKAETIDPEAYALFLQGRQLGRQRTAEGSRRAVEIIERALAIEPDYAPAWGELARVYTTQVGTGLRPIDEGHGLARDPVNPRGHHNLGNAYRWAGRWEEAAASYRTALSLSPGYIGAQTGIGQSLLGMGEPEGAFEWLSNWPA